MKITHWYANETLTIAISDEIDNHCARDCIEYMQTAVALYQSGNIVLDLSKLTFTDSSGLAVVMNLYRLAGREGRNLRVRGTPGQAMRVFRAAALEKIIKFTET